MYNHLSIQALDSNYTRMCTIVNDARPSFKNVCIHYKYKYNKNVTYIWFNIHESIG